MPEANQPSSQHAAASKQFASSVRAVAPQKQGLYDPQFEHDACGVGFVVDMKGRKSHRILQQGIEVLCGVAGQQANRTARIRTQQVPKVRGMFR